MNQALVDRIVSNVMAQLHRGSVRPVNDSAAAGTQSTKAAEPVTAVRSALTQIAPDKLVTVELSDSVITAELLEKSVRIGQPVKIGRRSVLTPSARDWLHAHRVDWSRGDKSTTEGNGATKGSARWLLIVQTITPTVKALHDGYKRQPDGWKIELVGQPTEAATLAIGSIGKAEYHGAVIVSEFAEVIACRANRNERVRAAVISDRKQLEQTIKHLGVNVVCINPSGKTFIEMRNLMQDCATVKPVVPAGWN